MIECLKQISAVNEKGRHAVVIMDGILKILPMTFRTSVLLNSPGSPELSPIEQVWSWLRHHYLAINLFQITKISSLKYVGLGIVFWSAPPEPPRCVREDGQT